MLPLLCLTFGLAFLSGLNLYLATFLTNLAVSQGWIAHPALAFLGHPAILFIVLGLAVVEFVVDKIPWVDSLWDAVHTLIRPAGALVIALTIAGAAGLGAEATTAVGIAAVLLTLSAHLTKSGLRLLINASPEPFTNILTSLVEDVIVVLLTLLLIKAPVTGFSACLILLGGTWIALPRLGRLVKTSLFLLWKKCFGSTAAAHQGQLPSSLTVAQETQLTTLCGSGPARAAWAVACVSGKSRALPGHRANRFGTLVAPLDQPGALFFLTKGWFQRHAVRISLAGATIRQESTFLSENLVIHRADDGLHLVFRFTRAEAGLVARLTSDLQTRLGLSAPLPPLPLPVPLPVVSDGFHENRAMGSERT
jgi:Domain of unknown function (DUF4126)